jgi:NADH dehydrogenase (ubiquinone) 1 beta subcomplex subunit 8
MIVAFSALAGFGYFIYVTLPERPVAKRSYPYGGLSQELGGSEQTPKVSPVEAFS